MSATVLTLLLLLLLFQLRGHSPATAHAGSQLLLPSHTQQPQGSNATARWEEGWKGRQYEDARRALEGYGGEPEKLRYAGKGSSAGGSSGGGSTGGAKGRREPRDARGRRTLGRRPAAKSGASSVSTAMGPAQCAIVALLTSLSLL